MSRKIECFFFPNISPKSRSAERAQRLSVNEQSPCLRLGGSSRAVEGNYQALCGMVRYEPKKEGGMVRTQVCITRGVEK